MIVRSERGFSLVELLVGTAILLAVTAGVFTMLNEALRRSPAWNDAADLQQRGRVAVDAVAAAVRGAAALDVAPSALTAAPAIDPSTGVADPAETFYLDAAAATLRRAAGGGDFPLVDAVEDLRFEVVDAATRRVRVTVRLRSALAGPLTLSVDVAPRTPPS